MKGIKFSFVGKRGNDRRTAFPFHNQRLAGRELDLLMASCRVSTFGWMPLGLAVASKPARLQNRNNNDSYAQYKQRGESTMRKKCMFSA
jgi:hypothetical protein